MFKTIGTDIFYKIIRYPWTTLQILGNRSSWITDELQYLEKPKCVQSRCLHCKTCKNSRTSSGLHHGALLFMYVCMLSCILSSLLVAARPTPHYVICMNRPPFFQLQATLLLFFSTPPPPPYQLLALCKLFCKTGLSSLCRLCSNLDFLYTK